MSKLILSNFEYKDEPHNSHISHLSRKKAPRVQDKNWIRVTWVNQDSNMIFQISGIQSERYTRKIQFLKKLSFRISTSPKFQHMWYSIKESYSTEESKLKETICTRLKNKNIYEVCIFLQIKIKTTLNNYIIRTIFLKILAPFWALQMTCENLTKKFVSHVHIFIIT